MIYRARPVESAADFPTFCARCGRRLVVEDRTDGFDPATGSPRYVAYAYCPRSWWERLLDVHLGHDEYVVDPRPRPSLPPPDGPGQRR